MRDTLAERLLAKVMDWNSEDVARERPRLQAMSSYKYDEYQQFSPGMRFVESLAIWLGQFRVREEREIAYDFAMQRLIFCSTAEIGHLVGLAFSDHVRPRLLRQAAHDIGVKEWHIARVANSKAFQLRQRQSLFLGLSDGARTDFFRRANPELMHEQVLQTYEIAPERITELSKYLRDDHQEQPGGEVLGSSPCFRTVVLLDDFSASGISYLRRDPDGGFAGKIARFLQSAADQTNGLAQLIDANSVNVLIVLYLATEQARSHIESLVRDLEAQIGIRCMLDVVQILPDDIRLRRNAAEAVNTLIEHYYDPALNDEHMRKGGSSDARYGFADCGLPLILSHNTPNNSLPLLWAHDDSTMCGLFPRVRRHKES